MHHIGLCPASLPKGSQRVVEKELKASHMTSSSAHVGSQKQRLEFRELFVDDRGSDVSNCSGRVSLAASYLTLAENAGGEHSKKRVR